MHGAGRTEQARSWLEQVPPHADRVVGNVQQLTHGRVLDRLDRAGDAADASRKALAIEPHAQRAAIGLAAALMRTGAEEEAGRAAADTRRMEDAAARMIGSFIAAISGSSMNGSRRSGGFGDDGEIPVAVALMAQAAIPGAPPPQTVYRAQTDVVVIDAAVTNGRTPVTNLTKNDFEVKDNGVVQSILDFSRETAPLDVTVTIDVSGSMTRADRVVVERALAAISGALTPADRAAVVTFGSQITERVPLQPGPIAADLSTVGSGGSAVFDALLLALVTPPAPGRRQFGLFMTDGEDNASLFDSRTVVETARHAG